MDWIRTAYRTKARLWAGDPTEVEIRWFRAEETALQAPALNHYVSSAWDDPKTYIPPGVGDVRWAPRQYDNGANERAYTGQRHCGPDEAWADGGAHGIDPELPINPDGSSACCSPAPWMMGGGMGLGGDAKWAPRDQRAIGGLGLGGAAPQLGRTYAMTGGLGLGGWARQTGPMPMFGGLGLGGSAEQRGRIQGMTGGLGIGGVSPQLGATQGMTGGLGIGGEGAQAGGGYIIVSIPSYPFYAIIQGGDRLQSMTGGLGLGGETEQGGDVPILGEIRWIPYAAIPTGWIIAQGDLLSRSTYSALFAVLGTTWGAGDGSTTFGTPNLQRRGIVGEGGSASFGPANTIGSIGGEEGHLNLHNESGVAAHFHPPSTTGRAFPEFGPTGGFWTGPAGSNGYQASTTGYCNVANAANAHNTYHPVAVMRPIMYTGV